MEAIKRPTKPRKVVPKPSDVDPIGVSIESGDSERASGDTDIGTPKPNGKTWAEVQARLVSIESPNKSVTQVYIPDPKYPVWHGSFGSAKVLNGDNYCVLCTGERIEL